jgi:hypothetical protein
LSVPMGLVSRKANRHAHRRLRVALRLRKAQTSYPGDGPNQTLTARLVHPSQFDQTGLFLAFRHIGPPASNSSAIRLAIYHTRRANRYDPARVCRSRLDPTALGVHKRMAIAHAYAEDGPGG